MPCCKTQVRIIAAVETIISSCLLALNFKILMELIFRKDEIKTEELGKFNKLSRTLIWISESGLILFFLIRVLYLVGEFLLAVFLNVWAYRENVNGLIYWFTITILFSIASRCYFIGGIIWGQFFLITVTTFSANLAFTLYSLVAVYFYIKRLISGEEEELRETYYEMV